MRPPSHSGEDVVYPYPATLGAEPTTTHCRGTLFIASIRGLKARGHYERYARGMAPEHLTTVVTAVGNTWIPMEVTLAHYRALDAFDLPPDEILVLGAGVVHALQQTFIGRVLKAASSEAGISPIVGLQRFSSIYARTMKGGGGQVLRIGPKDVRMEFVGLPLASVRYFRIAYRGFIQAGCEFFARRVVVAELDKYLSPTTLAYRVAWA